MVRRTENSIRSESVRFNPSTNVRFDVWVWVWVWEREWVGVGRREMGERVVYSLSDTDRWIGR